MTSAGQLTVGARFDGRTIREIAVNLHRPSVSRLFIGQLPDVVIKTVPYLFTLCAHAQRAAAVAAVNVALGETLRELRCSQRPATSLSQNTPASKRGTFNMLRR